MGWNHQAFGWHDRLAREPERVTNRFKERPLAANLEHTEPDDGGSSPAGIAGITLDHGVGSHLKVRSSSAKPRRKVRNAAGLREVTRPHWLVLQFVCSALHGFVMKLFTSARGPRTPHVRTGSRCRAWSPWLRTARCSTRFRARPCKCRADACSGHRPAWT